MPCDTPAEAAQSAPGAKVSTGDFGGRMSRIPALPRSR